MLSTETFPTVNVLGSRVRILQIEDAVALIEGWIDQRPPTCRQVVVSGYHGIWEAHKDERYKAILNSAALWVPDGIAPVLVARWQGHRQARRVPGADLMEAFFARADFNQYSSFFYGDTGRTLAALRARLEEKYPGHRVAGTLSPPFGAITAEEDEEHLRRINEARPDVLWVGLGCPRQDRWIHERLDRLNVPVAIGVGAALRFVGGVTRRAPQWRGDRGLEWAYRLLTDPAHCWRRSVVEGPRFLSHVLAQLIGLRKYD